MDYKVKKNDWIAICLSAAQTSQPEITGAAITELATLLDNPNNTATLTPKELATAASKLLKAMSPPQLKEVEPIS
jgi:hypothetical protein